MYDVSDGFLATLNVCVCTCMSVCVRPHVCGCGCGCVCVAVAVADNEDNGKKRGTRKETNFSIMRYFRTPCAGEMCWIGVGRGAGVAYTTLHVLDRRGTGGRHCLYHAACAG